MGTHVLRWFLTEAHGFVRDGFGGAPVAWDRRHPRTSFPPFVEELAMELFSTEALPFPIQAQAWPCALAGFDVIAVAPTGAEGEGRMIGP